MEIWKQIPGFERYEISTLGRVRSLNHRLVNLDSWKYLRSWSRLSGKRPYLRIGMQKEATRYTFSVHRLVYEVFIGPIPSNMELDHVDGDSLNNSLKNLRLASRSQNCCNMIVGNRLLPKGVSLRNNKYYAVIINKDKKRHYLGCFKTPEEAAKAYDEAAKKLHGEFARTNEVQS